MNPHNQAKTLTLQNPLYRQWVLQFTARELEKDLGKGDITTDALFKKPKNLRAYIVSKQDGILAGRQEIEFFLNTRAQRERAGERDAGLVGPASSEAELIQRKKLRVKFLKRDGARIAVGNTIASLQGDIREILKVERMVLNLLGRMSGVATFTSRIVKKIKKINPKILIAPTRKTLWGLLDKRAVALGGGGTHRLSLDNAVLIKDNHLDAFGRDIPKAIESFFPFRQKAVFFEIEVETPTEAKIACATLKKLQKAGLCAIPCFIMLDNFSPKQIQKTLKMLHAANLRSCAKIEASGGIHEENIRAYVKTGVDIISMGSLTYSAPMLDLTLRINSP